MMNNAHPDPPQRWMIRIVVSIIAGLLAELFFLAKQLPIANVTNQPIVSPFEKPHTFVGVKRFIKR